MDNNDYNSQENNLGDTEQYQRQRPTIRPLQPVGAKFPRSVDSNDTGLASEEENGPVFRDKPPKNPTLVGAICGILGLIIGGAGIFGLMQFIKKPAPECAECDCSKYQKGENKMSSNIETDFFSLEPQGQNLVYSPLSIRYGLSLLNAGASDTTKTQIEKVLGDEELPKYENIADKLSLANAVFIRDTYEDSVLTTYKDATAKDFGAEIIYDDFASTANIDSWVSNKTFGLIDKIGVQLTDDSKMVLANALAIQMDWQHKFETDDTSGRTFYLNDGAEITATTMNQTTHADDISYYIDNEITLLSMPLEPTDESALEFVAVMPSGDLVEYMNKVDSSAIETALENTTPASTSEGGVEIHFPKFKFEYELNFKDDLKKLGITQAFSPVADFSKMSSEPLYVGDAVHKANIDFSEDGIKAAAITAFVMAEGLALDDEQTPQPIVIDINHPFFFLIRDKKNRAIWFTGTVYEPNLWKNDSEEYEP